MHEKRNSRALSSERVLFGNAVRQLRARHGISQEQFGFRSGLHRNYVGAVERGEINLTFRTLMKLSSGLAMPVSEVLQVFEDNVRRQRAEALESSGRWSLGGPGTARLDGRGASASTERATAWP
jgi:transcriptional regulator with XRE-family HTH domain